MTMIQAILFSVQILLLLLIQGCTSSRTIPQGKSLDLPARFADNMDSSGIGNQSYHMLFPDTQLVSLIGHAIENNQDVLIASQRIEMARANYKMSKGAFFPTLFFESSAGVKRYADYTIDGVGNFDTNLSEDLPRDKRIPNPTPDYFIGFRSSWEIDAWGKLRNLKKAAYTRFLATENGKHLIITSLISDVASTYYTLLAYDAELEIIRKNLQLQQTALETTKIYKESGRSNELAVNQFTAQLLNTRALEKTAIRNIVETENRLNILLGRFPQTINRESTILEEELPFGIRAGIPSEMLLNRPDLRRAALELDASRAEVRAARAAFLPSLTINAYTGLNAFTSSVLFSNPGSLAFGVLGGLSAPVFNRNAIKANYNTAVAVNKEAHYSYQKAIISGFTEVSTTLKKLEILDSIASLKKEETQVLEQGVVTSNELFFSGYASYLDVINAQRNVLSAELELTNVKKEQLLSLIALYRALGGGWK